MSHLLLCVILAVLAAQMLGCKSDREEPDVNRIAGALAEEFEKLSDAEVQRLEKEAELMREKAPIAYAIAGSEYATARNLIEAGADVNASSPVAGMTPLAWAARRGHGDIFVELLLHGANPKVNTHGGSPLFHAATKGRPLMVWELLRRGVPVDSRGPQDLTPLMVAASDGHWATIKLLLNAGADASLENSSGLTAAELAVEGGHLDIVEMINHK